MSSRLHMCIHTRHLRCVGKVLIIPLDHLSCFPVVVTGIHRKVDMCQTDYSIHSELRVLPYSEGKYNIQANEKLTKVKEI